MFLCITSHIKPLLLICANIKELTIRGAETSNSGSGNSVHVFFGTFCCWLSEWEAANLKQLATHPNDYKVYIGFNDTMAHSPITVTIWSDLYTSIGSYQQYRIIW